MRVRTQSRIIRNMVVLSMALLFGNAVYAQSTDENGIHVSGGSSSAQKVSSNIGYSTMATGYNSFASGYASVASGHTSTALGGEAKATGNYSMALGNYVTASAEDSFVFGKGFSSAFPLVNSTCGIMMGVKSQYPTLTISAAPNYRYTGKVGIGNVTDPQAKLHIKGDAMEHASILLASTGTNKSIIQFRTDDNNITVGSDNVMKFNAASMQLNPSGQVVVNGAFKATGNVTLSGLAGSSSRVLTVGTNGQLSTIEYSAIGDNLGNHTAEQNINLNGKKIVGAGGVSGIYVAGTGNVGVNTDLPRQKLHVVDGNVLITKLSSRPPGSTNGSLLFGDEATTSHPYGRWGIEYLDQDGVKGLNFWKTNDDVGGSLNHVLFLCSEEDRELKGNVGIGTGKPKEKLSVNGKVLAKEVIVTKGSAYWPDYVFAPGYEMMSLAELEVYVNEHHHLPDVPSAKEVAEHGISLGEMNAILLEKVEELTRYVIDLQKQIEEMKQHNEERK